MRDDGVVVMVVHATGLGVRERPALRARRLEECLSTRVSLAREREEERGVCEGPGRVERGPGPAGQLEVRQEPSSSSSSSSP